ASGVVTRAGSGFERSPGVISAQSEGTVSTDRRDFIRDLLAMAVASRAGATLDWATPAQPDPSPAMVGVQMGPHTMLDEGIEHCLDLIQKTAAINTIFVY